MLSIGKVMDVMNEAWFYFMRIREKYEEQMWARQMKDMQSCCAMDDVGSTIPLLAIEA